MAEFDLSTRQLKEVPQREERKQLSLDEPKKDKVVQIMTGDTGKAEKPIFQTEKKQDRDELHSTGSDDLVLNISNK